MDIRLEPRTAAHPKREEIERLHETMKKRELGRKRRRLWSRFGVNLVVSVLVILPLLYALSIAFMAIRGIVLDGDESDSEAADA